MKGLYKEEFSYDLKWFNVWVEVISFSGYKWSKRCISVIRSKSEIFR